MEIKTIALSTLLLLTSTVFCQKKSDLKPYLQKCIVLKVKKLSSLLNLTSDQNKNIYTIYQEQLDKRCKLQKKLRLLVERKKLREQEQKEREIKFKFVLTKRQHEKYKAIKRKELDAFYDRINKKNEKKSSKPKSVEVTFSEIIMM